MRTKEEIKKRLEDLETIQHIKVFLSEYKENDFKKVCSIEWDILNWVLEE